MPSTFTVRTSTQEERQVKARDLMDALVVARATWPGEQFISIIESPEPPPRARGWQKGRPRDSRCGWCGERGHNARTCPSWAEPQKPAPTLAEWLLAHQPTTLEQAVAQDVPPRVAPPVPERRVRGRPRSTPEEPDERAADGTRLCECGEPSLVQRPSRERTCARCKQIEGSYLYASWGLVAYERKRGGISKTLTDGAHSPRTLPQLDSREIHSGVAYYIRELNRLKPYTEM